MDTVLVLLAAAVTLVLGAGAGVHLSGVVALNPAWHALAPADYVRTKQAADRTFPRLMRPLTLAGVLGSGALVVLAAVAGREAAAGAAGVATAAAVLGLAAVLAGDLPINRAMAGWDADHLPAGWTAVRARWERWFAVRTAATTTAAVAAVAALALLPR